MDQLKNCDNEIYTLICDELARQNSHLDLIASENHTTVEVMQAAGTCLTDKYSEGYPGKRYYGGCDKVDEVEQICIDRAKALFGAEHANVQAHCGSSANMAVYMACLKPGDKILSMSLDAGGHLSHGLSVNFSGKYFDIIPYGVDEKTETIDMEQIAALAAEHKPKLIIVGASAYPRVLDFEAFGRIARENDALLLADMAHIAGLVATGEHPSPVPHADFVTTTTHKTLRGPRSGLILCKEQWAKKINSAVFPGLQGGPLQHIIAAKAVAFKAAAESSFKQYCQQVKANAQTLAGSLAEMGWRIVSGGTDNHLMLVDLRPRKSELTGQQAENYLQAAGIVCNKNKIPFDTRSAVQTSGLRLGTPAITTRGLGEAEVKQLAQWIDQVLDSDGAESVVSKVRTELAAMCEKFPIPAMKA